MQPLQKSGLHSFPIFFFGSRIDSFAASQRCPLARGPRPGAGGGGAVLSSLRRIRSFQASKPLPAGLVGVVAQVVAAGQPLERVEGQLADADRFLRPGGDRRFTSRV